VEEKAWSVLAITEMSRGVELVRSSTAFSTAARRHVALRQMLSC